MAENEMIVSEDAQALLAEASAEAEKSILSVSKNTDFLPRLQVCGSNTGLVKEGKINQGVWAIVWDNDRYRELGKDLDVLLIGVRVKALHIPQDGSNPESYYNSQSPEFKKIENLAKSGQKDTGCLVGPEFLVWVPQVREFTTMFLGSATGRKVGPQFLEIMKREGKRGFHMSPAHIGVQFIKNRKGQSWHGPTVKPCTVPLSTPPEPEDLDQEVARFVKPPERAVEVVQEVVNETEGRER